MLCGRPTTWWNAGSTRGHGRPPENPTATNFTDDTPPASQTEYRVSARTPAPVRSSATTTSNTIPPVGFGKEKIPGIVDIFLGSTKVYRVMANDTQIWLG